MTAAFTARVDKALADRTLKLAIDRTTGTARPLPWPLGRNSSRRGRWGGTSRRM